MVSHQNAGNSLVKAIIGPRQLVDGSPKVVENRSNPRPITLFLGANLADRRQQLACKRIDIKVRSADFHSLSQISLREQFHITSFLTPKTTILVLKTGISGTLM